MCDARFLEAPINLIAEHGAYIQFKAHSEWQSTGGLAEFTTITANLLPVLESYTQYVPGSRIERKALALCWCYESADLIFGGEQARNLAAVIAQQLENTAVGIYHQDKKLEIRPLFTSKKFSVNLVLEHYHFQPDDILLTIGQTAADEEIYTIYPEQNIAIHIGSTHPLAKYFFNTPEELQQLLKKIPLKTIRTSEI